MNTLKTRDDCVLLAKQHGLKLDHYTGQSFTGKTRQPDWHVVYRKMLMVIAGANYGKRIRG